MKKTLLTTLAVACALLTFAQTTQTFNFTGAVQTFTVPPCVSSITLQTYGAQGGVAAIGGTSGLGGYATGNLTVTPGDILYIYVGGQNGYNGGGTGGTNGNPAVDFAGNGGGASDVRLNVNALANRVIVAGGGGGAGSNGTWPGCQVAGPAGNGGAGGGLTGGSGTFGVGTPCNCQGGGGDGAGGGTQIGGGIHGAYAGNAACLRANWTAGQDGTLAQGGNGSTIFYNGTGGGGGGGGGYYGGGSGGNGSDTTPGGGGGGGSCFTGTLSSTTITAGTRSGNGMVVITYNNSGSAPVSPTSITGSNSVCSGSTLLNYSITAVASATSYTWTVPAGSSITSGQGTTAIVVSAGSTSGSITVTANNSCGSSLPTQLAITIHALPTVAISPASPSVCLGSSITLTASGASTYAWSSGGNSAAISVSPTTLTSYTVTGTDAFGCVNTASVSVSVNPIPTVVANSTAASVCAGGSVTLSGSGASTYAWSGGVINAVSFVPISTLTYTVTGTGAFGCTNTATTTVTVNPIPTVTANSTASSVCAGGGVTLSGSGASTYAWSGGVINAVSFVPVSTLTYTVTGTNAFGCINTATTTVTVNALPTIIAMGSPLTVCYGSFAVLSASGATSYVWQPINLTGATVMVLPTTATTYTVAGTDVNGCIGTTTATISVNALPTVSAIASPTAICTGSSVTLTASGASTYDWMPGNLVGNTVSAFPSSTTTYTLTGTDVNGCMGTATTTVTVNSNPVVTTSASTFTPCLNDGVVSLTATPAGGVWTGTAVTLTTFNPTSAGVGPHILTYNYTDSITGCSASSLLTINVNACTGIIENTFANGIEIFPNPNNGIFTVSVNENVGDLLIEVMDLEGRVVFTSKENNVNAGFAKQIILENVSSGMYLMKLSSGNDQKLEKISVQK
ncbi:MAG: glycine-rich protein [Bacteroidetes bacterium]|nr:glycine-rich protein [Bacteroidota bacterium]